jgi:hypothetical protein
MTAISDRRDAAAQRRPARPRALGLATALVRLPAATDPFRATATPIYQTATFALDPETLGGPYD